MRIRKLLSGLNIIDSNTSFEQEIKSIKCDSRKLEINDMFIALEGDIDGHKFCKDAIKNGAKVVIIEKRIEEDLPYILVDSTRKAYALLAANFYDNAHKNLKIIGVVGTNGKTTTVHMINAILRENGYKTASIGTLGYISDVEVNTNLTTPDPMELHNYFFQSYKKGIEYIVMEVSAHSIFYKKIYGIRFDLAVFTNISQDHLDFFGTMRNYINTKLSFFENNYSKLAILNIDDNYGKMIIKNKKNCYLTYGLSNPSDVFAINIHNYGENTKFIINAFDEISEISMPYLGNFNVYNAMASIAVGRALFVPLATIRKAFQHMGMIKGRFNIFKRDITVIVDYAHTPDGLENLLKAVKEIEGKNIIAIFGCGGNRDKKKRPIMAEKVAQYADFAVITSDNPRYENPIDIIHDIEREYKRHSKNYICIENRRNAIDYGIKIAKKGDKVVIAGKGGENYIDIMGEKLPYSDKDEVLESLRRHRVD